MAYLNDSICHFFLATGYAALTAVELDIEGTATLDGQTGIYISNIQYSSNQNANVSSCSIDSYYQTNLNSTISLSTTDPTSSITYQVTIVNTTNTTLYYDDVIYDTNFYSNPNIIVETNLFHGQAVGSGQTITFTATFQYSPTYIATATTPYANTLNSFINFHFNNTSPAGNHTITYIGFSTNNYPTTVADGGNVTINFNSPYPTQISVSGNNNYTYANGILTITNVLNDITIENLTNYDFPVIDNNNQTVEIHAPNISSTNTIQVNDLLTKTFSGKNVSSRTINQVDVTTTYTTSSGKAQSINIILTINGQTFSQTMQFAGKQTNTTATASFTGITIGPNEEFTVSSTNNNITNGNVTISDEKLVFHYQTN